MLFSFSCIWHYPLHCDLSLTDTIIVFKILDGHTQGHLVYSLHKEVPFAGYLVQWACSALGLPKQQLSNLYSLMIRHQNNVWVVIFVSHLFTSLSRHHKVCGPTYRITNCSQWSHVFLCGRPSAPSGRRQSCLHASELGEVVWHICICCEVFPHCFYTCGVPITILHIWEDWPCCDKCRTFSWSGNVAWYPRRWQTWICSWRWGGHVYLTLF
jgi:hypothetical protein